MRIIISIVEFMTSSHTTVEAQKSAYYDGKWRHAMEGVQILWSQTTSTTPTGALLAHPWPRARGSGSSGVGFNDVVAQQSVNYNTKSYQPSYLSKRYIDLFVTAASSTLNTLTQETTSPNTILVTTHYFALCFTQRSTVRLNPSKTSTEEPTSSSAINPNPKIPQDVHE